MKSFTYNLIFTASLIFAAICLGIWLGMVIEQNILFTGMAKVYSNSNINVTIDLNETKLVNEMFNLLNTTR